MSRIKTHVSKGDTVTVISGNHKNMKEERTVLQVIPAKNQVIIEGVNIIKKHTRKSQELPEGGILEREGPIHISNVKLVRSAAVGKKDKHSK